MGRKPGGATGRRAAGDVFHSDCPARMVLDHVTSRWGVLILTALRDNDLRFHQLRTCIEGISEKMLSQTLRLLLRDGLVRRTVVPASPPQVSYGLTSLGTAIAEPLDALIVRIGTHARHIMAAQTAYDSI
ncbi:helix-turn-helix transcriptional regulator [Amycolatopsis acidicola]|uniref:Helix-turn-helix transcriptional regulator n=1 Tax=Amycolatopsis acidicola TaxID=2596893 RepID=A0A5N0VI71_9PSEU|nr:helix-turn-helix domain-containing protein [Amycolatopsis acidicola]KAA9166077.1 helix-turn-helix transcriptional regulator [Amycolatopsis acidicola]